MSIKEDKVSLPNYPHTIAKTCIQGNLRDILEFHGHLFTEAMVFGLASPLTFNYVLPHETSQDSEFILVNGQWHRVLDELACLMGLDVVTWVSQSNADKLANLKRLLKDQIPILIEVVLPYYSHYLNVPQNFINYANQAKKNDQFAESWDRFFSMLKRPPGIHNLVLTGLEGDKAYVVENSLNNIQVLPIDVLENASNPVESLVLHPQGRYRAIYVPEKLPQTDWMIKQSISKQVHKMMSPPKANYGLPGLKKMVNEISSWPEMVPEKFAETTMVMMWYISEKASGGGMYRKLYARFLKDSSKILNSDQLMTASNEYIKLSSIWKKFTYILLNGVSDSFMTLRSNEVSETIEQIYDLEIKCIALLDQFVKNGDGI